MKSCPKAHQEGMDIMVTELFGGEGEGALRDPEIKKWRLQLRFLRPSCKGKFWRQNRRIFF